MKLGATTGASPRASAIPKAAQSGERSLSEYVISNDESKFSPRHCPTATFIPPDWATVLDNEMKMIAHQTVGMHLLLSYPNALVAPVLRARGWRMDFSGIARSAATVSSSWWDITANVFHGYLMLWRN